MTKNDWVELDAERGVAIARSSMDTIGDAKPENVVVEALRYRPQARAYEILVVDKTAQNKTRVIVDAAKARVTSDGPCEDLAP